MVSRDDAESGKILPADSPDSFSRQIFRKVIHSESEMVQFAKEVAASALPSFCYALNGNLGSGKTFFVRHFCSYFGIDTVTSPTFSLINEYPIESSPDSSKIFLKQGGRRIIHCDFYRIKNYYELEEIGISEYLADFKAIVLIEWAELFSEILPKQRHELFFSLADDNVRTVTVNRYE